jgi:fucose permease
MLPPLYGYFADHYDVRSAYWVLFPCYLYLIFYAFYGHKIRHWTPAKRSLKVHPEKALHGAEKI